MVLRGCPNAHCRFMNGTNRSSVPLISYPGSGNTWTRGLLEKATGICTGAIFHDLPITMSGMVGEGITSGAVLAVKMHSFVFGLLKQRLPIKSALYVLRNPFDALVAEFTRRITKGQHTSTINSTYFGTNKGWNSFVRRAAGGWLWLTTLALDKSRRMKMHFIRYEGLKADKLKEMEGVMKFLGFSYDREELAKRLDDGYETFKRPHSVDFEHYTASQKAVVNGQIMKLIAYTRKQTFGINLDYLASYKRS